MACVAVGTSTIITTTNGGVNWASQPIPDQADTYTGISCASPQQCIVVGDNNPVSNGVVLHQVIDRSIDGGHTWTNEAVTTNGATLTAVSCTSTANCVAVGAGLDAPTPPLIATSTDGGTTWVDQSVPANIGNLFGVTCWSALRCVSVGQENYGGDAGIVGNFVVQPVTHGYWLVGSDGGIFSFGSAIFHGSTAAIHLNRPIVGITPTSDGGGYWLVGSDGGVFTFGDGSFAGSIPGLGIAPAGTSAPKHLGGPIVGMVPSANGLGYYMVGADGGVFAFNAAFAGSCPGIGGCVGSAVAVAPDASGSGYWLVTKSGDVYSYGDAQYHGAPGPQSSPITSMVRTPDGGGYWILDGAGQVFAYGDAQNLGSPGVSSFNGLNPATAIFADSTGSGYWVTSAEGKVFDFGDAPSDGDMSGTTLNGPIIAAAGY